MQYFYFLNLGKLCSWDRDWPWNPSDGSNLFSSLLSSIVDSGSYTLAWSHLDCSISATHLLSYV